jgi:hypothetical protein
MLMHGRDPIFPIHLELYEEKAAKEPLTVKEFRAELTKLVETTYQHALESFEDAIVRIKAQADKHAIESDITEGELVLYRDYDLRVGMSSKFKNPWKDTYRVRKLENQHAWITPITGPNEKLKRVHLNQIKRFYPEHDETDDLTKAPVGQVEREGTKPEEPTGDQVKGKDTLSDKRRARKEKRTQEMQVQKENNRFRKRGEGSKYNLRPLTNKK